MHVSNLHASLISDPNFSFHHLGGIVSHRRFTDRVPFLPLLLLRFGYCHNHPLYSPHECNVGVVSIRQPLA